MEFSKTPEVIRDIDLIADKVSIPVIAAILHCMDGVDMRTHQFIIFQTLCSLINNEQIEVRHDKIDRRDTH